MFSTTLYVCVEVASQFCSASPLVPGPTPCAMSASGTATCPFGRRCRVCSRLRKYWVCSRLAQRQISCAGSCPRSASISCLRSPPTTPTTASARLGLWCSCSSCGSLFVHLVVKLYCKEVAANVNFNFLHTLKGILLRFLFFIAQWRCLVATQGSLQQGSVLDSSCCVHVMPSPVYPAIHWHSKLPRVLVQTAFWSQLLLPYMHSLMSVGEKMEPHNKYYAINALCTCKTKFK